MGPPAAAKCWASSTAAWRAVDGEHCGGPWRVGAAGPPGSSDPATDSGMPRRAGDAGRTEVVRPGISRAPSAHDTGSTSGAATDSSSEVTEGLGAGVPAPAPSLAPAITSKSDTCWRNRRSRCGNRPAPGAPHPSRAARTRLGPQPHPQSAPSPPRSTRDRHRPE